MTRIRAFLLLPFLLLPSCTFLGIDSEPEPVSSPGPVQPVAAPVARRVDPNTAVLRIEDLGTGWKAEQAEPEQAPSAQELTDKTNSCGQPVNIPDPQAESKGEIFSNQSRFTVLTSDAAQFAQGQGPAIMDALLEDAQKCPRVATGGSTFYVWSITSPALGDEALRLRVILNIVRGPPFWMDIIVIRRGDAIALVVYLVVGHEIDPDFSNTIAKRADARLQGASATT